MKRKTVQQPPEQEAPVLEVASLIDVCFLLLIYFLVTSTLAPRERDLGMKLPTPDSTEEFQPVIEPLFIRIEASGEILTGLNASERSMDTDTSVRNLPLLGAQLELYASASRAVNSTPLVQIHADDNATQQRVIDVLNALASAGIGSVTFTDLIGKSP